MGLRHRKIIEQFGNVHFVTTSVMNHDRIFSLGNEYYEILLNSLKFLLAEHGAKLIAYFFMPSHIHLIIYLPPHESVSDFMRDFKKYTSTRIRQQLEIEGRHNKIGALRKNAMNSKTTVFKLWMDRFDDVIITTDKVLETKVNYLHMNPFRAGLVKDPSEWRYSSYRNYYLNDNSIINLSEN